MPLGTGLRLHVAAERAIIGQENTAVAGQSTGIPSQTAWIFRRQVAEAYFAGIE
jgi:hypothetical protein